uniref:Gustatory receptor candidate 15 n=1 Tax=Tribolium castaneum TaxID=7070 RepID=A2AX77_TRICA|nr:gustatory receptor candidate 15 [Tribolium castaneum]
MDIKSIKTCFYVAKFFAITPSSIYDKPTKLYQKLYPVLMFLIYTITEIYSVYERRYMNAHLSGIQLVVRNLLDISLYLNAYHVFVTMMTLKRHKWSTLFEILLKLESKDLSRTFYGFVIVAHLLFLVIFVLNIWCWIVEIGGWLAFTKQLLIKFVEVYPLFVLLIVSNVVLKILVEKYRHQKNFINESNVETVKFNLFLLSQAVETFNDIFGWTILQTVFFTVPRVLMYFDIFITEHESKPNWLFFLANFLTNLLFWEFDQIVNVAYRMETWNVVFNGSRKNLDVMKSFVNFRPSFTAARFFEIDRINAESRKPIRILFDVSSEIYNVEYKNVEFWRNIREDYDRLARLTQFLDKELSYLILFSIGFNCFWVMKLLYNVLRFGAESQTINFMFSFGFILLRFLSVFESCTRLNNESRKPSFVIQFSHIPVDNIEFAGALVTYELTLFQYHAFYLT